jgi:hypothetical protein
MPARRAISVQLVAVVVRAGECTEVDHATRLFGFLPGFPSAGLRYVPSLTAPVSFHAYQSVKRINIKGGRHALRNQEKQYRHRT